MTFKHYRFCPYCDSIFLRTNEEHTTDMANKIMNMYMKHYDNFFGFNSN